MAAGTLAVSADPGANVVSTRALKLRAETPLGRATIAVPPGSELENTGVRDDKITVRRGGFSAVVPLGDIAPAAQSAGAQGNTAAEAAIPSEKPAQSPSPAPRQNSEPLTEERNAFAGVPFGASIEEARQKWHLEKADTATAPDDPVAIYLREQEPLVLGGAVVRDVVYFFVNGKFYAVAFLAPDHRQSTILREALILARGEPADHEGPDDSLVWPGRAVNAHMVVNPCSGESRLLLFSGALQGDYEQSLKQAAVKTSADL